MKLLWCLMMFALLAMGAPSRAGQSEGQQAPAMSCHQDAGDHHPSRPVDRPDQFHVCPGCALPGLSAVVATEPVLSRPSPEAPRPVSLAGCRPGVDPPPPRVPA